MSYNTGFQLYTLVNNLNELRFEGRECDGCEDSTVYQVASVEGIDGIPTPSPVSIVRGIAEDGHGLDITMSCCGCGTNHDREILDLDED